MAEPEGHDPGLDLAAPGEELTREVAAELVELGAEALRGPALPAILAGRTVEGRAEPREVDDLEGAPVRRGDASAGATLAVVATCTTSRAVGRPSSRTQASASSPGTSGGRIATMRAVRRSRSAGGSASSTRARAS